MRTRGAFRAFWPNSESVGTERMVVVTGKRADLTSSKLPTAIKGYRHEIDRLAAQVLSSLSLAAAPSGTGELAIFALSSAAGIVTFTAAAGQPVRIGVGHPRGLADLHLRQQVDRRLVRHLACQRDARAKPRRSARRRSSPGSARISGPGESARHACRGWRAMPLRSRS